MSRWSLGREATRPWRRRRGFWPGAGAERDGLSVGGTGCASMTATVPVGWAGCRVASWSGGVVPSGLMDCWIGGFMGVGCKLQVEGCRLGATSSALVAAIVCFLVIVRFDFFIIFLRNSIIPPMPSSVLSGRLRIRSFICLIYISTCGYVTYA